MASTGHQVASTGHQVASSGHLEASTGHLARMGHLHFFKPGFPALILVGALLALRHRVLGLLLLAQLVALAFLDVSAEVAVGY